MRTARRNGVRDFVVYTGFSSLSLIALWGAASLFLSMVACGPIRLPRIHRKRSYVHFTRVFAPNHSTICMRRHRTTLRRTQAISAARSNRSFSIGSTPSTGVFNEMAFESFVSHMKQIAKVNRITPSVWGVADESTEAGSRLVTCRIW